MAHHHLPSDVSSSSSPLSFICQQIAAFRAFPSRYIFPSATLKLMKVIIDTGQLHVFFQPNGMGGASVASASASAAMIFFLFLLPSAGSCALVSRHSSWTNESSAAANRSLRINRGSRMSLVVIKGVRNSKSLKKFLKNSRKKYEKNPKNPEKSGEKNL